MKDNSMDDWRYWLTRAAFAAAILWLAFLIMLEVKGRTGGRRLLLALPAIGLLALIAFLIHWH